MESRTYLHHVTLFLPINGKCCSIAYFCKFILSLSKAKIFKEKSKTTLPIEHEHTEDKLKLVNGLYELCDTACTFQQEHGVLWAFCSCEKKLPKIAVY